jgi:hypothetical protein
MSILRSISAKINRKIIEIFPKLYVRRKKIPVVPVSYREKIRVGRSEIIFFLNIFFMVLAVFCWAICSRVGTLINNN